MRNSFCITCNTITPHNKKGCDICHRTIVMDIKTNIKEYLIPPTDSIKELNRGEGFKSTAEQMNGMATTPTKTNVSGVDINTLTKTQLVGILENNLTPATKLRLFTQSQPEKVIPEKLEKQFFVELRRTPKGARVMSYLTKDNYTHLTGHDLMNYVPKTNDDGTKGKGNMLVSEANLPTFIDSFKSVNTPVYWLERVEADSKNLPQAPLPREIE